jgi:2-polyprenyl-3-methyl-5-hydroxy-6-metoxy-1,4-benzoquinol methylase
MTLRQAATAANELRSEMFKITDAHYGRTAAVWQCGACGFQQCSEVGDPLSYYETLEDEGYEDSAEERAAQMRELLGCVKPLKPTGRLLDVGAGSGILVAEAQRLGYRAEGIEPSRWLAERAQAKGLPVRCGVLPHPELSPPYDVVMLVDVVEHVSDPIGLLRAAREHLKDDGVALAVTPDVDSLAARLLGQRWWHRRVAHIGYFNRATFAQALDAAGLAPLRWARPRWYFKGRYLAERIDYYLPPLRYANPFAVVRNRILPLNFFDSWLTVCCKA